MSRDTIHRSQPKATHRILAGLAAILLLVLSVLAGCSARAAKENEEGRYNVAVFVPGVVEGSPTYEMLVDGVQRAVNEHENATSRVVEGGFSQAEWGERVTALAATGEYDLIVTSNPSMPEIAAEVATSFPQQKFLVLDGYLEGNDAIHTVLFNQREQAFLVGHFAGLVTTSAMEHANEQLKVGLLAGQEYPIMDEVIRPGFELGVKTVNPRASVDFRVLGNWYDAGKAAELAGNMIDTGSDTILTIAGGGNQGVISAARDKGAYVLWYDSTGYEQAPGIVVGSSFVRQDRAAYEKTVQAIEGTLEYGAAEILGVTDGYVGFAEDHRLYERHVPESIRSAQSAMIERIKTGDLSLEMPVQ